MIMYGGQKEEHAKRLRTFADKLEESAALARAAATAAFNTALEGGDYQPRLDEARAAIADTDESLAEMKKSLNFGSSPDSAARLMSAVPAYHAAIIYIETTAQHIALLAKK